MARKGIFALAPEVEAARGHSRDWGSDRFGSAEPVIDYRDQEADASRNAANGLIFRQLTTPNAKRATMEAHGRARADVAAA